MSLGGVRDEAEIRGHRRTYIGALPGRLVRALRDAGTMNPVIMLDEVDKVGADWRGDPSAALLEVLDPAQNHSFRDHYLDVELDLSGVLFIATANIAETIPAAAARPDGGGRASTATRPRRSSRSPRGYLWPRQRERNGLRQDEVEIDDEAIRTAITEYTREAGVRNLERELGKVLRKTATGVASGEPTAPVRIDVEALREALGTPAVLPGGGRADGDPRRRHRPLGDRRRRRRPLHRGDRDAGRRRPGADRPARRRDEGVGADRALLRPQPRASSSGSTRTSFADRQFHVHVPAGAIPKDGPSAGITMTTALASLLSGRPVRHDVGMTGEITLQGRVLPIGGVKQKVLAAHAAGLSEVILPERNRGDLEDVPEDVREQMRFHLVMTIDEVLEHALEPAPVELPVAA